MSIENKLKELIKEKGSDLTNFCRPLGFTESTVRNALSKPDGYKGMRAENLFKICEALKIDMRELLANGIIKEQAVHDRALTQHEWELIKQYRVLDEFGTRTVDTLLSLESERNIFYDNKINYIYKPKAPMSAAAGLGDIIDPNSPEIETVKIPRTPEAESADFVIRISGNSMEPTYLDGSLLLVRKQPAVDRGQVGLFIYQGDAFVKIWDGESLKSINSAYEPIRIYDPERFQTVGRICGITESAD